MVGCGQGALIDNHAVEIRQSTREATEGKAERRAQAQTPAEQGDCTKILVRNVPFQVSPLPSTSTFLWDRPTGPGPLNPFRLRRRK